MLSLATELPTADVPAVVRLRTTQARSGTPARVFFFGLRSRVSPHLVGAGRALGGSHPAAAVEPYPPFARLKLDKAGACGFRGNDAGPEVLFGGRRRPDGGPSRAQRPSPAVRLDRAAGGHPFCNERVAPHRRTEGGTGEHRSSRGVVPRNPAAVRQVRRFLTSVASVDPRQPPLPLVSGASSFCRNVTAPKFASAAIVAPALAH